MYHCMFSTTQPITSSSNCSSSSISSSSSSSSSSVVVVVAVVAVAVAVVRGAPDRRSTLTATSTTSLWHTLHVSN